MGFFRSMGDVIRGLSAKEVSDIVAKWTAIVAAVVGGWIALHQYVLLQQKTLDDRQSEVLRFFERYSTGAVFEARQAIDRLYQIAGDARASGTRDPSVSWAGVDELLNDQNRSRLPKTLYPKMVAALIRDNQRQSVFVMIDFFDSLAACVRASLCDSGTAGQLFSQSADAQAEIFGYLMSGPERQLLDGIKYVAALRPE